MDVVLRHGDGQLSMPVVEATEGASGFGVGKLLTETGLVTYDPGFVNTAACSSAINCGVDDGAVAPDTIAELRRIYSAALDQPISATNLQRVLTRRHVIEPLVARAGHAGVRRGLAGRRRAPRAGTTHRRTRISPVRCQRRLVAACSCPPTRTD
jgi:hypothetical protein